MGLAKQRNKTKCAPLEEHLTNGASDMIMTHVINNIKIMVQYGKIVFFQVNNLCFAKCIMPRDEVTISISKFQMTHFDKPHYASFSITNTFSFCNTCYFAIMACTFTFKNMKEWGGILEKLNLGRFRKFLFSRG